MPRLRNVSCINYPSVDVALIHTTAIFPPVGIARLGDSEDEYFIGPELPMIIDARAPHPPTPDGKFRDAEGRIRRQAARFRVYAYDNENRNLGEINEKNGYRLTWKVHVKNTKAAHNRVDPSAPPGEKRNRTIQSDKADFRQRTDLIVDPGVRAIISNQSNEVVELKGPFKGSGARAPVEVNLGELQVDDAGHLLFIAAKGQPTFASTGTKALSGLDNNDWVDNVCDGWVSVEILQLAQSRVVPFPPEHRAAVASGPPKFAWAIHSFTSLFDIAEDACVIDKTKIGTPEFNMHIYPVLLSTSSIAWVHQRANENHGSGKAGNFVAQIKALKSQTASQHRKEMIFKRLRPLNTKPSRTLDSSGQKHTDMPDLDGDDSTLTELQYERFKKWKDHDFIIREPGTKLHRIEDAPLERQPGFLTRASLEPTIGASFEPGIEMCKVVKNRNTYAPVSTLKPPLRLNYTNVLHPGDLTAGLAVPWQSDFDACNQLWWPAARPSKVVGAAGLRVDWTRLTLLANISDLDVSHDNMAEKWHQLGFVTKPLTATENDYVESERKLPE